MGQITNSDVKAEKKKKIRILGICLTEELSAQFPTCDPQNQNHEPHKRLVLSPEEKQASLRSDCCRAAELCKRLAA